MAYFNFPFGGGGGMPHGHGGGGGGGQNGAAKKPKEEDGALYKALGLEKGADQNAIKKAFRVLAMKHHPDKGGDQEKFKEISKAYEVLSDPAKKELYDQHGMEGVEAGGDPNARGGFGGGADLFDILSGGGGRRRDPNAKRRGEDVVFPLKVTLEDLYNGMSKKLRLTKNVICKDCDGKGGKAGSDVTCKECKGQGIVIRIRQLGPGMIQQMQTTCDKCNGEGTTMKEADKCKTCKGAKVVKEKKTLEVFVTKGMKTGDRIPFRGEADEAPNTIPGDVLVVLQQKQHDVFKRIDEGNNLSIKKQITLQESLCGFNMKITHLDGRILKIKSEDIVTPGSWKKIVDEGMPSPKNEFQRGALYVEFEVIFPKPSELDQKTRQHLAKLLPSPPGMGASASASGGSAGGGGGGASPMDTSSTVQEKSKEGEKDVVEEVQLTDVNMEEEMAKQQQQQRAQHREAHDEDEDGGRRGGGQQAGCRAQ